MSLDLRQFGAVSRALSVAFAIGLLLLGARLAAGQSTQQEYPTPITESEISGLIKPRDVGDARLTSHFYLLEAGQGDLFINIATKNLNADFDVFYLGSLQPVTKVVVFADTTEYETGRVLYFRKPEKLLLRVQGRTPGDDAATYRLKFAGSFVASTANIAQPEIPKANIDTESGVRVNSVGTIVPTPRKTQTAERTKAPTEEPTKTDENANKAPVTEEKAASNPSEENPDRVPKVVVTENVSPAEPSKTTPRRRTGTTTRPPSRSTGAAANRTAASRTRRSQPKESQPAEPAAPDPLANVKLVIIFKDGARIDRPLPEVMRFTVDRGILTVISKDGTIGRYSMVDVAKVTIE